MFHRCGGLSDLGYLRMSATGLERSGQAYEGNEQSLADKMPTAFALIFYRSMGHDRPFLHRMIDALTAADRATG
jgi:hypothetical protein